MTTPRWPFATHDGPTHGRPSRRSVEIRPRVGGGESVHFSKGACSGRRPLYRSIRGRSGGSIASVQSASAERGLKLAHCTRSRRAAALAKPPRKRTSSNCLRMRGRAARLASVERAREGRARPAFTRVTAPIAGARSRAIVTRALGRCVDCCPSSPRRVYGTSGRPSNLLDHMRNRTGGRQRVLSAPTGGLPARGAPYFVVTISIRATARFGLARPRQPRGAITRGCLRA